MEKSKMEFNQAENKDEKYPWQFILMVGSLIVGALFMILMAFELI